MFLLEEMNITLIDNPVVAARYVLLDISPNISCLLSKGSEILKYEKKNINKKLSKRTLSVVFNEK